MKYEKSWQSLGRWCFGDTYTRFCWMYQEHFAEQGITLELVATAE